MNQTDKIILTIEPKQQTVLVERCQKGIRSSKHIGLDDLTSCFLHSQKGPTVHSGLLPPNCLSYSEGEKGWRSVTIIGANSVAGLRMRPIKVLLADEVDAYPVSAGTEGAPLLLAQKRQTTFWDKKTIMVSTPGNKGQSRILFYHTGGSSLLLKPFY